MSKTLSDHLPDSPETFNGIPVKRSPRRKRIAIKMLADGSCELLVPAGAADTHLQRACEQFAPWIKKQQHRFAALPEESKPRKFEFAIGSEFFFCGKLYELKFLENSSSQIISFRDEALWSASADPEKIRQMLEKFYRRQTRRLATGLLEMYTARFNISIGEISINGAKKRFGSCNSSGDINFSWQLAMYPWDLIELVVLHELAHRSEMNHSADFYKVLGKYLPDHRQRDKKLKLWIAKLALYPI
jgi:predicted metal-dependent hydrolase